MEKHRKYFLTGFCILLFTFINSHAGAQEQLNGYLETAAQNNPGLKVKFNEYMAALEVVPQVKSLPDPQIAFGYFIQPVETRVGPQRFKLSASQMFPWFGTLKAKENAAIQMAKAKFEIFEEAKHKLFYEVKNTFYNLYFNKKAIAIISENMDILNSFRKIALIKIEAGRASAVDEYRIEMEIGDLENQLALLKDKQDVLQVAFNNFLNVGGNEAITTPEILWEETLQLSKQAIKDSILLRNHQLLSLDFQTEALRFKQEVAKNAGKPDFSIGIDYTTVEKGDKNLKGTDAFIFPKVGITIPLYRNKYKAMVKEVVYLEAAKQQEKISKSNILENLFENTWKDFNDAKRRVALFKNQLILAEQSLKLLETEYATNSKNFEEILRMERKLLKYALELEKSRTDKHAAISFITYLRGK